MLFNIKSLHPGNLSRFFVVWRIFSKSTFSKKFFQEYDQSVKRLDPDQARSSVGPDLGPNCLQKLSADDTMS